MLKFATIARNAFMELVRQPIYLLMMSFSAIFIVFLSCVPYFGFGDDPKMVKDSVLAVMLMTGLFGAVVGAAASVAHEIRSGTALAVLSKPVGRAQFLLAKFVGVAGALTLVTYVNTLACLLASRMAFDAYGNADTFSLFFFALALLIAYAVSGFSNYFLRRQFVADAVLAVTIAVTLAFIGINYFDKHGEWQKFATGVDWRMVPASILILLALWVLAGVAIACATRWDLIPSLAVCSGLFLLGLMSSYLFGRPAKDGAIWASILYAVLPNWQLFWMADTLEPGKQGVPWQYLGTVMVYVAGYLGATLAVALALFEDRELS
jgi:ABC-type transport system involved in multi-copper enzyme maturation permease subunit